MATNKYYGWYEKNCIESLDTDCILPAGRDNGLLANTLIGSGEEQANRYFEKWRGDYCRSPLHHIGNPCIFCGYKDGEK